MSASDLFVEDATAQREAEERAYSDACHREVEECICYQNIASVVGLWPAIDLLLLRAAQAAGHGTPMEGRVYAAFSHLERGFDMLRMEGKA